MSAGLIWIWTGDNRGQAGIKPEKMPQKRGPKNRVWGPPGRGVLRFWGGGIQESRSYFGQKRPKNQKIDRFRGWCNITPSSVSFLGILQPDLAYRWSGYPYPSMPNIHRPMFGLIVLLSICPHSIYTFIQVRVGLLCR